MSPLRPAPSQSHQPGQAAGAFPPGIAVEHRGRVGGGRGDLPQVAGVGGQVDVPGVGAVDLPHTGGVADQHRGRTAGDGFQRRDAEPSYSVGNKKARQ